MYHVGLPNHDKPRRRSSGAQPAKVDEAGEAEPGRDGLDAAEEEEVAGKGVAEGEEKVADAFKRVPIVGMSAVCYAQTLRIDEEMLRKFNPTM